MVKKNKKLSSLEKNILYNLLLIRTVQLEMIKRYHPSDKMRCPMHFCTGQEIMPSAISSFMKKNDSIYSHHRSHGYFLSKKGSLKKMVAEFYGKVTGTNGGLAGSQELSDKDINFYSGTILSGALAMGVGDAFAKKYKSKKSINISVIGDGGMEEGIVYESLSLAALYKLPILFICENNTYSTHTHLKERQFSKDIVKKVKALGIESQKLSSNNPIYINEIMKKVINKARKNIPQFVEIETYRFGSHVGPEDDDHYGYRPKKEREFWIKNDPLKKISKLLKGRSDFDSYYNKIQKDIMSMINEAYKFADKSSFPKIYKNFNFSNKNILKKNFYDNNIEFGSNQEGHKPKPY